MDPNKYLESQLKTCAHTELRPVDHEFLESKGMEKFLYRILTSKKFRKWKIKKSVEERIKKAIQLSVPNNKPLQISFPFGGYKLWSLNSAPEVDWSEFFVIAFYSQFLAPILKAYKPGVELNFSADAVILKRMDNVPREDSDAYFNSFKTLIKSFEKYLPDNYKVDIKRVIDLYDSEEQLQKEVDSFIPELQKEYSKMSEEDLNKNIASSKLNIQWDGVENWNNLSKEEKKEKILMGPIIHDAYCRISRRAEFLRSEGKMTIFTTPGKTSIPLGTTKTSVTKFWTGFGVLEKRGDGFVERILSPKQLDIVKEKPHDVIKSNLVPLKNFKEIWVFEDELNFSKNN